MKKFIADLHIHSRFSIATSKNLSLPLLAAWAQIKGINVLGTGDCTHPEWRKEMEENLEYDEASGLYQLKKSLPLAYDEALPALNIVPGQEHKVQQKSPLRFMIQGEISSIYKRGGRGRRMHNLVFMPNLEAANDLSLRLAAIGNINSDGRPILGLDSRDLLEMVLECHPEAFLVPAHIWTPWFSLFGSKSGFDSVEECFGDLSSHIFAMETGLSSDPAMNRLLSALDAYRMISNSDAHSGENLAREANIFEGEMSYKGILASLKEPEKSSNTKFLGTYEFFPEEGKYHGDGHRKCGVSLSPEETRELGGICPECKRPLTVGVHYRVMELADRKEPEYPDDTYFKTLVPLREILGEIYAQGPRTKRVTNKYVKALDRFGSELNILTSVPEEELVNFFPPLGESIRRMRKGEVQVKSGFDGEFGVIRMFSDKELKDIKQGIRVKSARDKQNKSAGLSLLKGEELAKKEEKSRKKLAKDEKKHEPENNQTAKNKAVVDKEKEGAAKACVKMMSVEEKTKGSSVEDPIIADKKKLLDKESFEEDLVEETRLELNEEQQKAVKAGPQAVLVIAGPGTGKTRTLIARVESLLNMGLSSRSILVVTFTRKAATEIDSRLALNPDLLKLPTADTLHALALDHWHRTHSDVPVLLSEESAFQVFQEANMDIPKNELKKAWRRLSLIRETLEDIPEEISLMASQYQAHKSAWNLADYTDLLEFWLEQAKMGAFKNNWDHVLVDEIQDLSPLQLEIVKALLPPSGEGFFGIGDPAQSIYAFRGASPEDCAVFFQGIWPDLMRIDLRKNYRSGPEIIGVANALMQDDEVSSLPLKPVRGESAYIHIFKAPTAFSETRWITERVADLMGGSSHTIADMVKSSLEMPLPKGGYSPGDIAILVRTHALGQPIRKALSRMGIPVSAPNEDAFWNDAKVRLVIKSACRLLGIDLTHTDDKDVPHCPDKVLAKGPLGMAAYLSTVQPFDEIFWLSPAFRSLVKAYDEIGGWPELLTWINLQSELELVRAKAEKVQILTLHAAKGLEFPIIFMPCLEEGIIPFAGPMMSGRLDEDNKVNIPEEKRLFYVGLTRAKDALFLSHAAKRQFFGAEVRLKPSRFMECIPKDLTTTSTLVSKNLHQEKQLKLF